MFCLLLVSCSEYVLHLIRKNKLFVVKYFNSLACLPPIRLVIFIDLCSLLSFDKSHNFSVQCNHIEMWFHGLFQSIVALEKQTPEIICAVSQGNPDPCLMQLVGAEYSMLSPVHRSGDRTCLDNEVYRFLCGVFLCL